MRASATSIAELDGRHQREQFATARRAAAATAELEILAPLVDSGPATGQREQLAAARPDRCRDRRAGGPRPLITTGRISTGERVGARRDRDPCGSYDP
jgi:hypothetical protein